MKICQNLKLIIRNSKDDNFHRPGLPIRKGNCWLFGDLELNVVPTSSFTLKNAHKQ